jgi:hypothetical protein
MLDMIPEIGSTSIRSSKLNILPLRPSLLFLEGLVGSRSPSPGCCMSNISMASSKPQYSLGVNDAHGDYYQMNGIFMIDLLVGCQVKRETMRSDEPLTMINNRVRGPQLVWSISGLTKTYMNTTLPSEASRSFTGQSRTEAMKQ